MIKKSDKTKGVHCAYWLKRSFEASMSRKISYTGKYYDTIKCYKVCSMLRNFISMLSVLFSDCFSHFSKKPGYYNSKVKCSKNAFLKKRCVLVNTYLESLLHRDRGSK